MQQQLPHFMPVPPPRRPLLLCPTMPVTSGRAVSKNQKRKKRLLKFPRIFKKSMKTFFSIADNEDEASPDAQNPFELDNNSWLNPSAAQPELNHLDPHGLQDEHWQLSYTV